MRGKVVIFMIGLVTWFGTSIHDSVAGDEAKTTTVRAEDIGKSVQVIGRVGIPLRKTMSLSGVWVKLEFKQAPPKPDSGLRFRVDTVNGRRLEEPVDFRQVDIELIEKEGKKSTTAIGTRWELHAYENWPILDHPSELWGESKATGSPPQRGPTRLVGVPK